MNSNGSNDKNKQQLTSGHWLQYHSNLGDAGQWQHIAALHSK